MRLNMPIRRFSAWYVAFLYSPVCTLDLDLQCLAVERTESRGKRAGECVKLCYDVQSFVGVSCERDVIVFHVIPSPPLPIYLYLRNEERDDMIYTQPHS